MSNIDEYFTPPAEQTVIPEGTTPDLYSIPHSWYAFVIDGEVAWIHVVQDQIEHFNAVLASSPQVVKIPHEQSSSVVMGWTYDGTDFVPPVQP